MIFQPIGSYDIKVAVQNLKIPDPVSSNDTLSTTIKSLRNDPISLASNFVEDF